MFAEIPVIYYKLGYYSVIRPFPPLRKERQRQTNAQQFGSLCMYVYIYTMYVYNYVIKKMAVLYLGDHKPSQRIINHHNTACS